MAKKWGTFEEKCVFCGTVKINGEWRGSIFITEKMTRDLPEGLCPWCLIAKSLPRNILFALD
ncbi:MAG TPA: hypothetical protein PLB52_00625 [Candidatus Moranbacteria bacterium]|nr:hypothetical protein [Candidatus Moranbacteria bacterium]